MKKSLILGLALVLGTGFVAGQTSQAEVDPGLIKADSPLYGLDVAFDNALMRTPLGDPGSVAHERASEIVTASLRNNTDAFEQAARQLNRTVERADQRHTEGLEKASTVLRQRVLNGTAAPEATVGLETAITKIEQAKQRIPEKFTTNPKPDGNESGGGFIPDIGGGSGNGPDAAPN